MSSKQPKQADSQDLFMAMDKITRYKPDIQAAMTELLGYLQNPNLNDLNRAAPNDFSDVITCFHTAVLSICKESPSADPIFLWRTGQEIPEFLNLAWFFGEPPREIVNLAIKRRMVGLELNPMASDANPIVEDDPGLTIWRDRLDKLRTQSRAVFNQSAEAPTVFASSIPLRDKMISLAAEFPKDKRGVRISTGIFARTIYDSFDCIQRSTKPETN